MSDAEGPVVEVEGWLAHLVPRFLDNRLKDLEALAPAVRGGDFDAIRRIGHNLKGAAGSYGFAELAEIGLRLEAAAQARSVTAAAAGTDELETYMRTVKVVYR